MNKKLLIAIFTFFFGLFVFCAPIVLAQTTDQPSVEEMSQPPQSDTVQCQSGNFCPNVSVGSFQAGTVGQPISGNMLGQYIQSWYTLIIGIVGIIATVMLMWGGMKWLTSRGNSGVISDAKEIIWSAIIGLALTLLSWTILFLINPKLLEMQDVSLTNINYKGSVDTIMNYLRSGDVVLNNGVIYQGNKMLNTVDMALPPGVYSGERLQKFQQECNDFCGVSNGSTGGTVSGNYDQGFSCNCVATNGTGLTEAPHLNPESPTVPPLTEIIPGIKATPNATGGGYTLTWNDMGNQTFYDVIAGQAQQAGYNIEDHRNGNPPYLIITPQEQPGSVTIPNQ